MEKLNKRRDCNLHVTFMSSYVRRWCLECRWQPQKRCWWATGTRSPEEPFCESYLENGAFRKTYSYIIHKSIYNKQYTSQLLSCRRPCGIRCGREEEKDPGSDDYEAGGDVVEEDVPVQFSSRWWTWKMLDNLASGRSIFHLVHFIWNFSSKPTTE